MDRRSDYATLETRTNPTQDHGWIISRTLVDYVRDISGNIIVEVYELEFQDGARKREVIEWAAHAPRDWLTEQLELERIERDAAISVAKELAARAVVPLEPLKEGTSTQQEKLCS